MNFVISSDIPRAFSKEELVKATENEEELQRLIMCIREKMIDHRDVGMKTYSSPKACWKMPSLSSYHPLPHQRATPNVRSANRPVEENQYGFCRTFSKWGHGFSVLDQYSRYPVVEFVTSTSAEAVIPQLTRVFTTYGIPEKVKADNGLPFNKSKFAKHAQELGFRHRKSHWGGRKQMMTSNVKRSARAAKIEGKAVKQEVQRTVSNYHATPLPVTRESPDKLMFGREIRRKLPGRVAPLEKNPWKGQGKEEANESLFRWAQTHTTELDQNWWLCSLETE